MNLLLRFVALFFMGCISVYGQTESKGPLFSAVNVRGELPGIPVPTELKNVIPAGATLRIAVPTKLASPKGETIVLFDNNADTFPEVHLWALSEGRVSRLFDETIAGIAGLQLLQSGKQLLVFGYHVGFDQADNDFIVFDFEHASYHRVFQVKTSLGQFRVIKSSPLRFEIWTADWSLDKGESCVWCPHRYRIRMFDLVRGVLQKIASRITPEPLDPETIADNPFGGKYQAVSGPNP